MNKFSRIAYLTAVWLLALTASAVGQPTQSQNTSSVSPRFGIQYTTEGAGFESLGSVDVLIPLFQTPGNNVTFVQGRLFVDNDSNMGGHGLVGHRVYDQKNDRIVGIYIGYDARDTGNSYFKQLGVGFETLGKWDFRTNAYIPLGDSRQQVGNTKLEFAGNNVFAERVFELGLHGVDAEIGTKIADLGSGDIRGYAGAYYFSAAGREAFGWKARVEARPTSFVGVNFSLQNDALFDTRAVLSVGVSFPGSGTTKGKQQGENWSRMGNLLERRTAIATTTKVSRTALINPATNQPWNIIYVANSGNSNGTIESPYGFGDFQKAVGDAQRNPGSLIYVRSNNSASTLPPFTIPANAEVASTIGRTEINTTDRELPVVRLPFAGQGVRPTIAGDVTFGNNTTLVGFTVNGQILGRNVRNVNITGNLVNGRVRGENIGNVNIINNQIQNAEGIDLFNATGKVNVVGNTLSGAGSNSILISNDSGTTDIAIASNSLRNSTAGIQVSASGNAQVNTDIQRNTVSNALQLGIGVEYNDNSKGSVLIRGNTVSNVQLDDLSDGIYVGAYNTAVLSNINVLSNSVTNTSGRGISVGSYPDSNNNSNNTNVSINGNTIDKTGAEGIAVEGVNGTTNISVNTVKNTSSDGVSLVDTTGTVNLNRNTISDNQGKGITISNESRNTEIAIADNLLKNNLNGVELDFTGNATAKKVLISGNEITGKGFAVDVNVANNSLLNDLKIKENIITGTVEDISQGIQVGAFNSAQVNTEITNNTIKNTSLAGIGVEFNQNSQGSVDITKNTISNVQADELSDGVYVDLQDNAKTSGINISDNKITNTTGRGIGVGSYTGNSGITLAITGNTVEQNNVEGIAVEGVNGSANISNNTVKNTLGDGVSLVDTTGSVNLNNNTISDNQGNGIAVEGVNGTTSINNNTVKNTLGDGVSLVDTTGSVNLNNNTISDNQGNGIAVEGVNGTTNISNNTLKNASGDGINLVDTTGSVNLNGNTISDNQGNGITISNESGNTEIAIANNQIKNNFSGVQVIALENASVNTNITGNTISDTPLAGIGVEFNQTSKGRVNIANNTISNVQLDELSDGIYVELFNRATTSGISISDNTITNTTGRGISIGNYADNTGISVGVMGNNINQTAAEGIAVEGVNGTTNVSNNTVKNASEDGINLVDTTGRINLNSNTISDNQGNGITISNESGNTEIAIANNQINNNSGGVTVELAGNATANAQVTNNTINRGDLGVEVSLTNNSQLNNLTVTGNTIRDTSFAGVGIELNNNSRGRLNIVNNQIANVRFDDFSDGIYIELFDNSSTGGISILGNSITNTSGRGVSVGNYAGNTGTNVEITGNRIDTTDAQGIGVEGVNGRTTVRNNTINNAVGTGIYVEGQTGPEDISGNTITNTRP